MLGLKLIYVSKKTESVNKGVYQNCFFKSLPYLHWFWSRNISTELGYETMEYDYSPMP